MKQIKLFDSELKLMELIWQHGGPITAKQLSQLAAEEIGWNKNTTYTVIKKLVVKRAIKRVDPHYICQPLITRADVQQDETRDLIDKLFQGSVKVFFNSFLKSDNLTEEEITELKDIINKKL